MNMLACSVCFFGAGDDPMNISLGFAMLCMLIILVSVLGLFAKFFLNVRKRSHLISSSQ